MNRPPAANTPGRTSRLVLPRRLSALLALAAIPAMVGTARAEVETYALDPVHTRVMFGISHAGFSNALGTVSGSTGTLRLDPDDLSTASVSVSVPLTRIDLGDDKWNAAALAGNLLDGEAHPVATFVSTRVESIDATHAIVHGTLTLHGVAQEAALQVTFNQLRRHPLPPFRRTAGFSASATISRTAFGITAWQSVIGDSVELRIEAEATRSNAEVPAPTAPAPEATVPPATTSAGEAAGQDTRDAAAEAAGEAVPDDDTPEPAQSQPADNDGDADTDGTP